MVSYFEKLVRENFRNGVMCRCCCQSYKKSNYITNPEVKIMDLNLKNKIVVVTGGSKGIGFAIAKEFLAEGAEVFITGRNLESLKKAEQELSVYGKLHGVQGDGTVLAEIEAVAAKAALLALTKTSAGESVEVTGGHNIVLNPWQSYEN